MFDLDKFDRYDQMLDSIEFDLLLRRRCPKPKRSEQSERFGELRVRRMSRDEWKRNRDAQRDLVRRSR